VEPYAVHLERSLRFPCEQQTLPSFGLHAVSDFHRLDDGIHIADFCRTLHLFDFLQQVRSRRCVRQLELRVLT
jgi:hypothetical protein